MIRTVLQVPVRDNEGKPFPRGAWRGLEARLSRISNGLSWEGNIHGRWTDPATGKVYSDLSRRYTVALQSWYELPSWLLAVQWAREAFRQQAMYIEVAGVPEIVGERKQSFPEFTLSIT